MARYIFLGAFYTVLAVIVSTLLNALWRSYRALWRNQAEPIRWHSDFHDLPAADRVCRHVLTGEFSHRECPNGFDCRQCPTHAAWIQKHPAPVAQEREEEVCGMNFPLDRFYHRGHTWARPETDGTVTIGLDEIGRRLLGTPDAVGLPAAGTQVRVNGPAFRFRKRNADVRVLSPVDGEVVETGGADGNHLLRVRP